jgi:oxygen-independent coproporphyrinogen-3 oxidase
MPYSLYIHIPFCKKKCAYCDFPSYAGRDEFIPEYLEALKFELEYYYTLYKRPAVSTIYIGGGTPTLLSEEQLSSLFTSIKNDFDVSSGAEISIEANPGTVTREKLKMLIGAGVNRISLGAQTFNNSLLKKIGRIHSEREINDAFHMAREAGFKNINLDLIFALPGENMKDWQESLAKAVKLSPEHISTYNLQIEEDTPLYLEKLEGGLNLPDEDKELEMYKYAIRYLTENGYSHYEISNFAKPGSECEHNKAYWTLKEYISAGAGAHSFLKNSRIENTPYLDKYLTRDMRVIKTEHANTKKENMQEMVFLGLRLIKGFNLGDFTNRFGISMREIYKKELAELIEDGLIEMNGKNLKLTENGLFLANEVFKKFL